MKNFWDEIDDQFPDLEKSLRGDHDERLQAIFREHPNVKASVDAGTLRVWFTDAGTERWEIISKRAFVSKALHRVPIGDDQHEEIESRAKELADLIEKHPYLKEALQDHWAKVVIQENGNLGLEFTQGHSVHLHCFDEPNGVAKALRSVLKASDSPMTDELIESQLPDFDLAGPLFEVGGFSLAAGSTKDFTFPVNPLSLGQHIEVVPVVPLSDTWAGIVWKTWVSAINEITFRIANVTNSTLRPAVQGFFEIAGISMHNKAGGWRGELAKHGPVEYTRDEADARVRLAVAMAKSRDAVDGESPKYSCGF